MKSPKITPSLLIIFSITVISVMGTASIAPAFPEFRDYFQISTTQVGLLITVFTIPGIVFIPFTGWLADKYGRKSVLIPSLFLFGIAGIACFFVSSFSLLLILRFFQGLGSAPLNALNNTLITDFYNGKKRIAIMGYNGGVLSISTALFPALGGLIATLGWNYPFLLPLLAFPLILFLWIYIKEHRQDDKSKNGFKKYIETIKKSVGKDTFWVLFSVLLSFILLFGVFITFFPFLMDHRFHFGSKTIGILMAVMSLGAVAVSFSIGKNAKRVNLKSTLHFSFLFYVIAFLGVALSQNIILLIVSILIFGIAQGCCEVCSLSLLTFLAPRELRGIYMSFNGMAILLGQTIGPILMGWLVGISNLVTMFFIAAGMSLLYFSVFFLWKKKALKS